MLFLNYTYLLTYSFFKVSSKRRLKLKIKKYLVKVMKVKEKKYLVSSR